MKIVQWEESIESPPKIQRYVTEDGTIVNCDEDTIGEIWLEWCCTEGVSRYSTKEGTLVYKFPEPTEIKL